jgi:hypothetical protein
MRYLSWAFYPLAAGYAVYSLVYREHRGWYSWLLSSAVSFIYMFGFITMCPQLYLNYKLKSVAHLPWRMLTYKFINTFIDDLFAFIIKMPTLHRLSVFRDDIVFFVYLYQRWAYPVDFKRENEFGFVPAEHAPQQDKKDQNEQQEVAQQEDQKDQTLQKDKQEVVQQAVGQSAQPDHSEPSPADAESDSAASSSDSSIRKRRTPKI